MGDLWALLRAAVERLNQHDLKIRALEATIVALEQQLREARGY